MSTFRFAIMGAGNIAHQFCDAVTLVEDCEVSAIASKDLGRAQKFAEECSVAQRMTTMSRCCRGKAGLCLYCSDAKRPFPSDDALSGASRSGVVRKSDVYKQCRGKSGF